MARNVVAHMVGGGTICGIRRPFAEAVHRYTVAAESVVVWTLVTRLSRCGETFTAAANERGSTTTLDALGFVTAADGAAMNYNYAGNDVTSPEGRLA